MFNLLRCLLEGKRGKNGLVWRDDENCCWLCVFHLTEFMIFHRWSVLRRARAPTDRWRNTKHKKIKLLRHLVGHTQDSLACEFCFFFHLNRKKLLTWCSARCFVCYYTIFEFSQSFILPFHHHIRRWHLARILCAAFVWISFEFHRARQQQIHPTIEMRMPYIVYIKWSHTSEIWI